MEKNINFMNKIEIENIMNPRYVTNCVNDISELVISISNGWEPDSRITVYNGSVIDGNKRLMCLKLLHSGHTNHSFLTLKNGKKIKLNDQAKKVIYQFKEMERVFCYNIFDNTKDQNVVVRMFAKGNKISGYEGWPSKYSNIYAYIRSCELCGRENTDLEYSFSQVKLFRDEDIQEFRLYEIARDLECKGLVEENVKKVLYVLKKAGLEIYLNKNLELTNPLIRKKLEKIKNQFFGSASMLKSIYPNYNDNNQNTKDRNTKFQESKKYTSDLIKGMYELKTCHEEINVIISEMKNLQEEILSAIKNKDSFGKRIISFNILYRMFFENSCYIYLKYINQEYKVDEFFVYPDKKTGFKISELKGKTAGPKVAALYNCDKTNCITKDTIDLVKATIQNLNDVAHINKNLSDLEVNDNTFVEIEILNKVLENILVEIIDCEKKQIKLDI